MFQGVDFDIIERTVIRVTIVAVVVVGGIGFGLGAWLL